MFDFEIEHEAVKKILCNLPLKSGPGPDGVLPHCLKFGGETILIAVVEIGRELFASGRIPDMLKGTWVTPVWKGTDKEDPKDYRPIAITNHLMKVLERVVRPQMVDFLKNNGVLGDE